MNLVSTGIGSIVAEFVENRLVILDKAGIKLYVIVNYGEPKVSGAPTIKHIYFHSFRKAKLDENLLYTIRNFFNVILKLSQFIQLIKIAPVKNIYKPIWALERIGILSAQADIIHIQWIGSVKNMYWLKKWFNAPILSSARGSQVTIYPYIDHQYRNLIKECILLSDVVHCVSNSIKNALMILSPEYPENKIFVNYNGVNIDIFFPITSKTLHSEKIVLLSVGTFMWRKNFIAQFQLVLLLLRKGIKNFKLVIIGGGKDEKEYQQIVHVLGITDFVEIRGYIPPTEINRIYQEGDIYLSSSLAEGLSNSVMEACACGLPAIVFNCEGMEELIDDSVTGFIVPPFDIEAMSERCIRLINDSNLRVQMGKNAALKIRNQFNAMSHALSMIEKMKSIALHA